MKFYTIKQLIEHKESVGCVMEPPKPKGRRVDYDEREERVLNFLREKGRAFHREIAEFLNVDKDTARKCVERLKAKGLVETRLSKVNGGVFLI